MFTKALVVLTGLVVLCVGVCWPWFNSQPVLVSTGGIAGDTTTRRCVAYRMTPTSEAVSKALTDSAIVLHNWNPSLTDDHARYKMIESYSTDVGSTWQDALVAADLSNNLGMFGPSLVGNGGVLHATWIWCYLPQGSGGDSPGLNDCKYEYYIAYSRSPNFGQHFFRTDSIPTMWWVGVKTWPQDEFPHLAVNTAGDGNQVMIVYQNPASPHYPYFIRSTDAGFTWSTPAAICSDTVSLTNVTYTSKNGSEDRFVVVYSKITYDGDGILIKKIYSIYTTNCGTSWTGKTVISPSTDANSDFPVVAANPTGSDVMCVWRKDIAKTLKSCVSTNAGSTWSASGQLLGNSYPADDDTVSPWPSLAWAGGAPVNFLCAWASKHGSAYRNIFVSNGLTSWSTPTNATVKDSANSYYSYHGPRVSWYDGNTGPYMFITFARDTSQFGDSTKFRRLTIWETRQVSPTTPGGPQSQGVVQGLGVLAPMVRVYPNPAAGPVRISFSLGEVHGKGALKVYTVTGELVKTFSLSEPGNELRWDLKDEQGKPVANGVYFLRLEGAGAIPSKKIVVMR